MSSKSVQQECLARVSSKSVLSRVSSKSVLSTVSSKCVRSECPGSGFFQECQKECQARMSHKDVSPECLARVSYTRVFKNVGDSGSVLSRFNFNVASEGYKQHPEQHSARPTPSDFWPRNEQQNRYPGTGLQAWVHGTAARPQGLMRRNVAWSVLWCGPTAAKTVYGRTPRIYDEYMLLFQQARFWKVAIFFIKTC